MPLSEFTIPVNGRSRNFLFCRAGHATTLLRQRDHVFRPKNCLVFYCIMSAFFVAATSLSLKGHNIYRIFLVNKALFRCCIVVVAELKNCRVPALLFGLIISSFLSRSISWHPILPQGTLVSSTAIYTYYVNIFWKPLQNATIIFPVNYLLQLECILKVFAILAA